MDATALSFESIINNTSRCVILCDASPDYRVVFTNLAFTTLTGYSRAEAQGRNCRFLQGPGSDPEVCREIREALAAHRPVHCEILNYRKDGSPFWNDVTIDPVFDADGTVCGFIGVQYDCTHVRQARDARAKAEQQLTSIVDSVPGYVFRRVMGADLGFSYPYVSRSLYRLLDLPDDTDWTGADFLSHVHADDRPSLVRAALASAASLSKCEIEVRIVSPLGAVHWFRSVSLPAVHEDGTTVWDGVAIDITTEKQAAVHLAYLAGHDALTGLANRSVFNAAVIRAIAHVSPDEHQTAVFFIDLDGFKIINETMGHARADNVLSAIGRRLLEFATLSGGVVARLGGDEFAVLVPSMPASASGLETAEALCETLRHPVTIDGEQAIVEASVGAAVFPRLSDSSQTSAQEEWAAELIRRATLAMEAAKRSGTGTCRLYTPDLDDQVRSKAILRKALQQAIEQEQFTLRYQPIVDLRTGAIIGAEALIRWNHPALGLQKPDTFIPFAEQSGLIVPIGAWVIKTAMRQAEAWNAKGLPRLLIAINVSSVQLQKPGFVGTVERALQETGADPRQFEFELTEGTLLETSAPIKEQMYRLKELGFSLAIDDFGTGHATFQYLREFPVDKIKIDQQFVRNLTTNASDATIVLAIVDLSHALHLQVVAEGIETGEQRDFLLDEGCPIGQGYHYSAPLSPTDFEALVVQSPALSQAGQTP